MPGDPSESDWSIAEKIVLLGEGSDPHVWVLALVSSSDYMGYGLKEPAGVQEV